MKEEGSSVVPDVVSGVSSRAVAAEGSDPILIPGATLTQLPVMKESHVPLSFFCPDGTKNRSGHNASHG